MNLSKLKKNDGGQGAWHAAIHAVTKSDMAAAG